jgi:hypothetical protein
MPSGYHLSIFSMRQCNMSAGDAFTREGGSIASRGGIRCSPKLPLPACRPDRTLPPLRPAPGRNSRATPWPCPRIPTRPGTSSAAGFYPCWTPQARYSQVRIRHFDVPIRGPEQQFNLEAVALGPCSVRQGVMAVAEDTNPSIALPPLQNLCLHVRVVLRRSRGLHRRPRQTVEQSAADSPGVLCGAVEARRAPERTSFPLLVDGPRPGRRWSGHVMCPDHESWCCPTPKRRVHVQLVHGTLRCRTLSATLAPDGSGGSAMTGGTDSGRSRSSGRR